MIKSIFLCLLALILAFSSCGCGHFEEAVESDLGTTVEIPEIETQDYVHIRDKNLLYSQYDNTEIVNQPA